MSLLRTLMMTMNGFRKNWRNKLPASMNAMKRQLLFIAAAMPLMKMVMSQYLMSMMPIVKTPVLCIPDCLEEISLPYLL